MKNKRLLWLDDVRNPMEDDWLVFSPISEPYDFFWVKNYEEFCAWIKTNGLPDGIAFDHDLGPNQYAPKSVWNNKEDYDNWSNDTLKNEKTGLDCAKFLIEYCINHDLKLPKFNSHSANPYGKENILSLLNNYKKFSDSKP